MDSSKIKARVMHYFRFRRRYKYIATEVSYGQYIADVMAANEKEIIEIEIKTCYSDFLADFKKRKHGRFQKGAGLIPNKFYFAADEELSKKILDFLAENSIYKQYGVVVVSDKDIRRRDDTYCGIAKTAKTLNKNLNKSLLDDLVLRMSSELTTFHLRSK